MKNKIRLRKLNRTGAHRTAMFRNMVTSLVKYERVKTTLPKAKALRHFADRVVTWAKRGERQYRSKALGFVRDKEEVTKLWTTLAPRYADRAGGYSRVLRCGFRSGDRAPMAIIEYVGRPGELRRARPGTAAKAPAKGSAATAVARLPTRAETAAAAAALSRSKQQDLR